MTPRETVDTVLGEIRQGESDRRRSSAPGVYMENDELRHIEMLGFDEKSETWFFDLREPAASC